MCTTNYNLIYLNTARNAICHAIKMLDIKLLHLPYYLCPAVRKAVIKENVEIKYYHIDKNFYPDEKNFEESSFILYPDYFGVCTKIIDELCLKYKNIIIDNAQALFSQPKGIASVYSIRKFAPMLREGAYLYIKSDKKISLEKSDFCYKLKNLDYNELCDNENRLNDEKPGLMGDCTLNYIKNTDFNLIKEQKISNFNFWNEKLKDKNALNLSLSAFEVPFGYPYLAKTEKEATKLVLELNRQGKIIYEYWKNMPGGKNEKELYKKLVVI